MYDSVDVWVRNWPSVQTSKTSGAATLHVRRSLGTHYCRFQPRGVTQIQIALRIVLKKVVPRWLLRGLCLSTSLLSNRTGGGAAWSVSVSLGIVSPREARLLHEILMVVFSLHTLTRKVGCGLYIFMKCICSSFASSVVECNNGHTVGCSILRHVQDIYSSCLTINTSRLRCFKN